IRSPLIFHWPMRVAADAEIKTMCAHIDLLPTVLDACEVQVPEDHQFDGISFLPLLTGERAEWPKRQVVFQTHRGNVPQKYHHFALHEEPWKLVHPSGFGKEGFEGEAKLELYNLEDDPKQKEDLAAKYPKVLERLRKGYEDWFEDVSSTRKNNYLPPRIVVGTRREVRTVLTRQDWRHVSGQPWGRESNGFWLMQLPHEASFEAELIFKGSHPVGKARILVNGAAIELEIANGEPRGHKTLLTIPAGDIKFQVEAEFNGKKQGPHQVILTLQEPNT
ncbi:MAG: sulfatase/phosphatase domain-containing protein, partial [Planctomycetota bacterium]